PDDEMASGFANYLYRAATGYGVGNLEYPNMIDYVFASLMETTNLTDLALANLMALTY
nr:hypothetical protein [Tanacetum cinerariifolium]